MTASSPTSTRSRLTSRASAALLLLLLSAAAPAGGAAAEPDADTIARGRAIAEAKCSVCHAVGATDESPTRINVETSFRDLYKRYPIPMLEEAARTGSVSGHDEMPGFDFSPEDAHALLAYIDSLAPGKPGYVSGPQGR